MSIHVYIKSLPNLPSPQESPLDSSSDHLYLIAHWLKISKGESSLVITTCCSSVHSWESVPSANSNSLASPCDSQGGLWVYPSSVCFVMIWCFHGATVSLSFFCNILPCFLSVLQLTLTFPQGSCSLPSFDLGLLPLSLFWESDPQACLSSHCFSPWPQHWLHPSSSMTAVASNLTHHFLPFSIDIIFSDFSVNGIVFLQEAGLWPLMIS